MTLSFDDIAIYQDNLLENMDLRELFPSNNPIEIEVGSGKGTFIRGQAKAHKEINYIGIEWANKFYRHFVERVAREDLTNVRVMRTNASDFISKHVQDESIDNFYLFFPDPWPKTRHNLRRFMTEPNIAHVHRILKPGGKFLYVTDHAGYFEWTKAMFLANSNVTRLFKKTKFPKLANAQEGEIVGTNYERKYMKEGRPFYKMAFIKKEFAD